MVHGVVGRPVVLGRVDLPRLERRIDIAVGGGFRHRAQQPDHFQNDRRILHADRLARKVRKAADGLAGIERPGPGVVPAQAHAAALGESLQKFFANVPVQHPPHMAGIPVEVGQHQHIQLGQIVGEDRQRKPGKVHPADGQLLPYLLLGAVLAVGLYLNDHLAPGALPHKVGEILRTLSGGIISGLVVGIGQHVVRHRLRRGAAACQLQRCKARPGQKCPSAHDALPLCPCSIAHFAFFVQAVWKRAVPFARHRPRRRKG